MNIYRLPLLLVTSIAVFGQTKPILPQLQVNTDLSNAPVTGKSIPVSAGQDLQAAINSAQPGDEIVLQAGQSWTGSYVLPNKGPSTSWITIRSSAVASLPLPGHRVSPNDASNMAKIVAAGPTEAFHIAAQANHYRLIGLEITEQPKQWVNYGLILQGDPNDPNASDLPSYITIDRCYIHGQALGHIKFGWQMNGSYLAIIDSYVSEFHGIGQDTQALTGYMGTGPLKISNNFLEGAGENIEFGGAYDAIPNTTTADVTFTGNYVYKPDSWRTSTIVPAPSALQGSGASGGSLPPGTYYYAVIAQGTAGTLDSLPGQVQSSRSPEVAVSVGGGQNAATLQWTESLYGDSQDTRIADNYVILRSQDPPGAASRNWVYFKTTPSAGSTTISFTDTGAGAQAGFGEAPRYWLVKNLFEIKNGARWLVDGNIMENNWLAGQNGFSILLTPRNETPFMPGNKVTDFTFRNNVIRHIAGGVNIGSEDDTQPPSYASLEIPTARISFVNNLFDDVNWKYNGNGVFFETGPGPFPGQQSVQDIILDHNTVLQTGNFADIATCCGTPVENFSFTNNVFGEGTYGWVANGLGQFYSSLTLAITNLIFTHNVWAGDPVPFQVAGNYFPTDISQIGFVNYNGGNGGDYHLASTSPYKGLASDGTDPGANIDTIDTVLSDVVGGKDASLPATAGGTSDAITPAPTPVPVSTTSATATLPTGLFELANQNSGKCLTAQNDYTLAQFTCSSANPAQLFALKPSYDASSTLQGYEVYSPSMDLAVDVWNISTADGATIGMYKFAAHANQLFTLQPDGNGSFILVAKHSSSCFDIAAFATSDGVSLEQWGCNGGSNQAFQVIPVPTAQSPA